MIYIPLNLLQPMKKLSGNPLATRQLKMKKEEKETYTAQGDDGIMSPRAQTMPCCECLHDAILPLAEQGHAIGA